MLYDKLSPNSKFEWCWCWFVCRSLRKRLSVAIFHNRSLVSSIWWVGAHTWWMICVGWRVDWRYWLVVVYWRIVSVGWRVVSVDWRVVNCQWRRRLVSYSSDWWLMLISNINCMLRLISYSGWWLMLVSNINWLITTRRLLISNIGRLISIIRLMKRCRRTIVVRGSGKESEIQENNNDDIWKNFRYFL